MRDKCQSGCWESVPNRHVLKTVPNTLQSAPVAVSSAADKMMAKGGGEGRRDGKGRDGIQGGVSRISEGGVRGIPEDGARRIPEGEVSSFPQGGVIVFPLGGVGSSKEKWLRGYGGVS